MLRALGRASVWWNLEGVHVAKRAGFWSHGPAGKGHRILVPQCFGPLN